MRLFNILDGIINSDFIDETLSISDFENENTIFFVNPITENWIIKSKNTVSSVSIYNVLGQSIFELKNNSSNKVSINTENWNSGIYILSVYTDVGTILKQIIKN